jgi:hypothetical protein
MWHLGIGLGCLSKVAHGLDHLSHVTHLPKPHMPHGI